MTLRTPRPVDVLRLTLGTVTLARPDLVLRLGGASGGAGVRATVRVLGGRYVVQSAAGMVLDRVWIPPVDAGVDLAHAATMLALAARRPRHRRLALLSAAAATCFAAADLRERAR